MLLCHSINANYEIRAAEGGKRTECVQVLVALVLTSNDRPRPMGCWRPMLRMSTE
jgi:hypothetical protein